MESLQPLCKPVTPLLCIPDFSCVCIGEIFAEPLLMNRYMIQYTNNVNKALTDISVQ